MRTPVTSACEHGAARSVVAAAYFNRLATEKRLPYRAVSRGVNPEDKVPPVVVNGLAADGLDVRNWTPIAISADDVHGAAKVVTFACKLPASAHPAANQLLQWDEPMPSVSESYESARQSIVKRVNALIDDLTKATRTRENDQKTR